jgi:YD repeat-containing protein
MLRRFLVFSVVCAFAALPAVFGQHPNLERGFAADKVYAVGQIDDVNLFNGNVVVTIPLGQQYPLSSSLSYGLRAVHNGKVWDYVAHTVHPLINGVIYTHDELESLPDPNANAGFGWRMSLGRIVHSYEFQPSDDLTGGALAYESPDGALHTFHDGTPALDQPPVSFPATPQKMIYFTRDSSYLRMQCSGLCVSGSMTVESPDGTVRLFSFDTVAQEWRLNEIHDRYVNASGQPVNWVRVAYNPTSSRCQTTPVTTLAWEITDSQGRAHTVCFADMLIDKSNRKMVVKVALQSFGGAYADYGFAYDSQTYLRQSSFMFRGYTLASPQLTAPALTSIQLPERLSYSFTYINGIDPASQPAAGNIQSVTLPTNGRYVYEYGPYLIPTTGLCGNFWDFMTTSPGIIKKRQIDAAGTDQGAWTYVPQAAAASTTHDCTADDTPSQPFPGPNPDPVIHVPFHQADPSEWVTTTVIEPDNTTKTVHYFSAWPFQAPGPSLHNFLSDYYGLPFTQEPLREQDGHFLSSELYHCPPPMDGMAPDGTVGGCTLAQSTYVVYESDAAALGLSDSKDRDNRQRVTQTVFWDRRKHYTQTENSLFDGLGHYRASDVTSFDATPDPGIAPSNFANTKRSTITAYNQMDPDVDPFDLPNGNLPNTFPTLLSTASWQLNTFTRQTVTEGSQTTRSLFCFDRTTGFLKRSRVLAGATQQQSDLLQSFTADTFGNVSRKEMYGGDPPLPPDPAQPPPVNVDHSAPVGALCDPLLLTSVPKYRIDQTYAFGTLATARYFDTTSQTPLPFLSTDNDIDKATGLALFSRDSAGVSTTYDYDTLGRLKSMTPPLGSVATSYTYTNASPGVNPSVSILRTSLTGVGAIQQTMEFDFLGRKILESKLMPDGSLARRQTTYDIAGRTIKVTEWEAVPSHFTFFDQFDVFGRPGKVTAPDGQFTTFTYDGMRSTSRTVTVGAGISSTTQEFHDSRGRLIQVIEPQNNSTTTYTYDIGDRLTNVSMVGGGVTQPRSFAYDNRGFLQSETHPESGLTRYDQYDAAGHPHHKGTPIAELNTDYDAAERVISIGQSFIGPLKEFVYGTAGNSLGKLDHSVRHNYEPGLVGDVAVTETYTYDSGGHISNKVTAVAGQTVGVQSYAASFQYDDLDSLNAITYPACSTCLVNPPGSQVKSVFKNGLLSVVNGYTSAKKPMTYWPNGLYQTITHGTDGPTITQTIDETNGMARPASITVTGATEQSCPPSAAITAAASMPGGGTGSASVPSITGATYNWSATNATITDNTLPTITFKAACAGPVVLSATVTACGSSASGTFTIAVAPPTVVVSGSTTIGTGATAFVTATYSGALPWSITWSDGFIQSNLTVPSATRSVLPATTTTYTVTSLVGAGCVGSASGAATITVVVCDLPGVAAFGPPSIQAGANGTASMNTNAIFGSTLLWTATNATIISDPTEAVISFTAGCIGPVTLGVIVTTPCGQHAGRAVTFPLAPPLTLSGGTTIAPGNSATLTATYSGIIPWSITWSDGFIESNLTGATTTHTVTPTATTTYTASVTAAGCTGAAPASATVAIAVCSTPGAVLTAPSSVFAGSVSTASVVPTPGATYVWSATNATVTPSADGTSATVTAACSGPITLSVTATPFCGPSATGSVSIPVTPPTASVAGSTTIPAGGFAVLTATYTGALPWSITWSDGFTQATGAGTTLNRVAAPGQTTPYTITSLTGGGCPGTATGTATVALCVAATAAITTPSAVLAAGSSSTASVPSVLGTTYSWTATNATITSPLDQPTITFTAGCAGAVTLNVAVTSCGSTINGTLNIGITQPTLTLSGSATIPTGGSAVLTATFTGIGPWTITWSDGLVQSVLTGTSITRTVSPTVTTAYLATFRAGACTGTSIGSPIVTVLPCDAPGTTITTAIGPMPRGAVATASVVPVANATYAWSATGATITSATNGPSVTFTTGCGIQAVLNVTATASCGTVATGTTSIDLFPATLLVSGTTSIPQGSSAVLTATYGGGGTWGILWSDGFSQSNITGTSITRTVSPAQTTLYTVSSLVNAGACTSVPTGQGGALVTVTCPAPSGVITAPTVLPAGSVSTASVPTLAGATYNWTATNATITSLSTGPSITFTAGCSGVVVLNVTVTTSCGTTASGTSNIGITPATVALSGSTTIPALGSATLTATYSGVGPWTITWFEAHPGDTLALADGVVQVVTGTTVTRTVSPSLTTIYTATFRAACNGNAAGSATVTVLPCVSPSAVITAPVSWFRGGVATASVPVLAGATYAWTATGATITSAVNGPSITFTTGCGVQAAFNVTVTAACGTVATGTTAIGLTPATLFVSGTTSIPQGSSAVLTATYSGGGSWSILWSDGFSQSNITGTSITRTVSPSQTTLYTVTSLVNAGACTSVPSGQGGALVTVTCPAPSGVITAPTALPAGSVSTASVPTLAGATYSWTATNATITSVLTGPSITFTAACSGAIVLNVTVTTSCGTTASGTVSIGITPPTLTLSGSTTISSGGSAILTATHTGIAPWTITWSDGLVQTVATGTSITRSASPTVTTAYLATFRAGACSGTSIGSPIVTVLPCVSPSTVITAPASWPRGAVATASVPILAGATYAWTATGATITSAVNGPTITFTTGCGVQAAFNVTVTAACGTVATGTTSIDLSPATLFVSGTTSIPQGSSAVLTATYGGGGSWSILWSDGFSQSNITGTSITRTVSPAQTTLYTVTSLLNAGGCISVPSGQGGALVTVTCPTPSGVISAPGAMFAGGVSTTSVPTLAGATYSWTATNATVTSVLTGPSITFTAACSGAIVLNVTVTTSCGTTASGTVSIGITPSTLTLSGSTTIAPGGSAILTGTYTGIAPWTITWTDGLVQTVASGTLVTRNVSPTATTAYLATFRAGTCSGTSIGSPIVTVLPH